jgi:hypothetical protein
MMCVCVCVGLTVVGSSGVDRGGVEAGRDGLLRDRLNG